MELKNQRAQRDVLAQFIRNLVAQTNCAFLVTESGAINVLSEF